MAYKTYIHTKNWTTQKPPLGSQINWSHPLSQGLVGCWLMNEGGGTIAKDLASNIYSWIAVPARSRLDSFGYYVDGTFGIGSEGLQITYSSKFDLINDITVVCGCKPTTGGTNQGIWFRNTLGTFRLDIVTNNLRLSRGNVAVMVQTAYTPDSKYHVFAATSRKSRQYIYIDGLSKATATDATDFSQGTDIAIIGADTTNTRMFLGYIYFFYLYNRVLSLQEIQSLYVAPYQMIMPLKTRRFFSYGEVPPVTARPRRRILINCLD